MDRNVSYTRVMAEDQVEYICPLELARRKTSLAIDDLDNCVEVDVVGRYSGNLNIVDHHG